MRVIVCAYRVKIKDRERERERRITQESYPGSPNPATSSPHTSCEIIHYSIQLVETSNQHYKVLITPDQSVTPVLSTSAGFYNSLRTSKRKVGIFYLKTIKPNRLWEIQYTLYERLVWDRIYTQLVFEGMMIRTHSQYVIHKSVMS